MTDLVGLLPLACWPLDALEDLRDSITHAFQTDRIPVGPQEIVACDWLLAVHDELRARATFDLADAVNWMKAEGHDPASRGWTRYGKAEDDGE
jgi:hypothetical protein